MPDFQVVSDFAPSGDQPQAIEQIVEALSAGEKAVTLLGATGTGKTFTAAKVIEYTIHLFLGVCIELTSFQVIGCCASARCGTGAVPLRARLPPRP
ncbi:MAG: DEAD/DEAH box helicase family protein [Actinobacteria bacterium]|nr:DEAD/DEAH box helicase family protein [Actinomycetota bacterium]